MLTTDEPILAPSAGEQPTAIVEGEQPTTEPVVNTAPVEEPKIPLAALHAERIRRKDAESKMQGMEARLQELEGKLQPTKPDEEFDPAQLDLLRKAAKKIGLVPLDELKAQEEATTKQEIINAFVAKNPNYNKSNDPYDVNWESLLKELEVYNTSTPQLLKKALEKANQSLVGDGKAQLKAQAKAQTNSMASVGSGGGAASEDVTLTPEEKARSQSWGIDEKYLIQAKANRLAKSKR